MKPPPWRCSCSPARAMACSAPISTPSHRRSPARARRASGPASKTDSAIYPASPRPGLPAGSSSEPVSSIWLSWQPRRSPCAEPPATSSVSAPFARLTGTPAASDDSLAADRSLWSRLRCALVRAASRLFSTRLRPLTPCVGKSADAARTSACATSFRDCIFHRHLVHFQRAAQFLVERDAAVHVSGRGGQFGRLRVGKVAARRHHRGDGGSAGHPLLLLALQQPLQQPAALHRRFVACARLLERQHLARDVDGQVVTGALRCQFSLPLAQHVDRVIGLRLRVPKRRGVGDSRALIGEIAAKGLRQRVPPPPPEVRPRGWPRGGPPGLAGS